MLRILLAVGVGCTIVTGEALAEDGFLSFVYGYATQEAAIEDSLVCIGGNTAWS
jgi:hypothetical protein